MLVEIFEIFFWGGRGDFIPREDLVMIAAEPSGIFV